MLRLSPGERTDHTERLVTLTQLSWWVLLAIMALWFALQLLRAR